MKRTYEAFCFPPDGGPDTSQVFECQNEDETRRLAADYADQCGAAVELCRLRYRSGRPQVLPIDEIEPRGQHPKTPDRP
jgi:hypothetical protein